MICGLQTLTKKDQSSITAITFVIETLASTSTCINTHGHPPFFLRDESCWIRLGRGLTSRKTDFPGDIFSYLGSVCIFMHCYMYAVAIVAIVVVVVVVAGNCFQYLG